MEIILFYISGTLLAYYLFLLLIEYFNLKIDNIEVLHSSMFSWLTVYILITMYYEVYKSIFKNKFYGKH
jgi:hypothetical protein